jgi:hypothetical protein
MRDSLRGLTAAGPSRVGTRKAMRARDVSRDDVDEDGAAGAAGAPVDRRAHPTVGQDTATVAQETGKVTQETGTATQETGTVSQETGSVGQETGET